LFGLLVLGLALRAPAQTDEMTVSQLNLQAGTGQAAYVRWGSHDHVYSMGAKGTGFFIEDGDKEVFSIDPKGSIHVRSEVLSAESLSARTLL